MLPTKEACLLGGYCLYKNVVNITSYLLLHNLNLTFWGGGGGGGGWRERGGGGGGGRESGRE